MFTYTRFVAFGILAFFGEANAQASDVLGLKLGMTPVEARAAVASKATESVSLETVMVYNGQQVTIPNSKRLAWETFYPGKGGVKAGETVQLGYYPTQSGERLGFVGRTQIIENTANQPDRDVLMQQLKAKYGEPTVSRTAENGGVMLGWVLSPQGFGVLKGQRALQVLSNCNMGALASENWLQMLVPKFPTNRTPVEECGTRYLSVSMVLSGGQAVSGIYTYLVDLEAATSARDGIQRNGENYVQSLDAKRKADTKSNRL